MTHKLISCAKIATYRMHLYDREDKMQDAILDILEKGYQEAPNALVIRIMKNKIIDDFIRDERKKRKGNKKNDYDTEFHPAWAEYDIFELFKNISYRNYLLVMGVVLFDAIQVSNSLSMPYKTVIAKYRAIKRELRRNDKDGIRITGRDIAEYTKPIQNR